MKVISVEDTIYCKKSLIIDVRSPSEYEESTIPGAINIPLFTNKEREELGTLYHTDKELAYEKGFKIGCSKLYDIYEQVKALIEFKEQKVIIFCWRGGMRSKSIATNLSITGLNVFQLKGGYKAYRRFILQNLDKFKDKFYYYNLHGHTGVGKTILLNALKEKGEPVLDLEELAKNRGSIFGSMGLGKPQSQKMFDSLLFNELSNNTKDYFFIESESKRIGNIMLPDFLVDSMNKGEHILIKSSIEKRIQNIKKEYLPLENKDNITSLILHNKFIIKKMGKDWVNQLLQSLYNEDYDYFIKMLLVDYYDPLYSFSEEKYQPYISTIYMDDFQKVANLLREKINNIDRNSNV
ncbi:tRNA 2-selenouridine(34) synthase MnmH [Irregularibacter muris]|uniref:tRNA 2-selenouridine(34) synthase MnmH n=1 Tax=Irregularibacter muris TaxID=1796619 RepID=A0AAE3HD15_9FIRM|nr:tRNA 2-selenouridine(34) synthase MnmH [Irregularibacter muris]MCR1898092.1 tRNA 2-selenouridine(34) synthase MnmH [Irregularibacter muris]